MHMSTNEPTSISARIGVWTDAEADEFRQLMTNLCCAEIAVGHAESEPDLDEAISFAEEANDALFAFLGVPPRKPDATAGLPEPAQPIGRSR